jgi:hypothetical protein
VVLLLGPGHGLVEHPLVPRPGGPLRPRALGRLQRDSRLIGQHGQRLGKGHALHLHDEAENVAADVADPALEGLPLGIDLQAGAAVVVPGAQGHIVPARTPQLDVFPDQIDNVDRLLDTVFSVQRRSQRHRRPPCGKTCRIHSTSQATIRRIHSPYRPLASDYFASRRLSRAADYSTQPTPGQLHANSSSRWSTIDRRENAFYIKEIDFCVDKR